MAAHSQHFPKVRESRKVSTMSYIVTASKADREVSGNQPLSENSYLGNWHEVELSACPLGCKVYLNDTTGERVVGHNRSYGCKR